MRADLDRTQQRILGVLIEKEMAVPETYPLTLNALVAGCNQKSNRDPVMELEEFEIEGALMSLCLQEWVARREGSRALKYVHRVGERLGVHGLAKAVLAELLLRGPQTPGELERRVARMGCQAGAAEIGDQLSRLAGDAGGALVAQLPRRPREHQARWQHCLGAGEAVAPAEHAAPPPRERAAMAEAEAGLTARLEALEARVAELERRLG